MPNRTPAQSARLSNIVRRGRESDMERHRIVAQRTQRAPATQAEAEVAAWEAGLISFGQMSSQGRQLLNSILGR